MANSRPPPRRLAFNGSRIGLPENPSQQVLLRGVNLMFMAHKRGMDAVQSADRLLSVELPSVNVVRVVANHWRDAPSFNSDRDCYSDNEA